MGDAVDQLHAAFPHILKASIKNCLTSCDGNVDLAAEKLLTFKTSTRSRTQKVEPVTCSSRRPPIQNLTQESYICQQELA